VNTKEEEILRAMGTTSVNVEGCGDNFRKY
jgi:hypothetical protein